MTKTLLSLSLIAAVASPIAFAEEYAPMSRSVDDAAAVASSQFDGQSPETIVPPGRGGRGGWGRGGRGGRGDWGRGRGRDGIRFPIPFPFPFPRQNVCYARDAYGQTYQAYGNGNRRYVQNVAVQSCYQQSYAPRTCRPIGCN